MRRVELAGAAHLELVSGGAQLRPEDTMFEAMLQGWRAQQTARGLREDTMVERAHLMRRFFEGTPEKDRAASLRISTRLKDFLKDEINAKKKT